MTSSKTCSTISFGWLIKLGTDSFFVVLYFTIIKCALFFSIISVNVSDKTSDIFDKDNDNDDDDEGDVADDCFCLRTYSTTPFGWLIKRGRRCSMERSLTPASR